MGILYPKNFISYYRDICTSLFIASQLITARKCNQPGCLLADDEIMKMWYVDKIECYSAVKENEIYM